MFPTSKLRNPFYPLLIVVGIVFSVTAVAYGVMALQALHAAEVSHGTSAHHPLLKWLAEYGDQTMLMELAVLGVLTVAAICSDDYWDRQAEKRTAATERF